MNMAAKKPTADETPRAIPPLQLERMQRAEHVRNEWRITLNSGRGQKYEDLFQVSFWRTVEHQLRGGDIVEVTADDNSIFAILYILTHTRLSEIQLVELVRKDLKPITPTSVATGAGEWRVEYRGPFQRWCVIDNNGRTRAEQIESKDHAASRLHSMTGPQFVS